MDFSKKKEKKSLVVRVIIMTNLWIDDKSGKIMLAWLFVVTGLLLNLFGMGFFEAAHEWLAKKASSLKSVTYILQWWNLAQLCFTQRRSEKYMNNVTHFWVLLISTFFLLEISKFCYFKKYKYRLYFNTSFLILLTFCWIFTDCFNKHGYNFYDVSKNDYPRPC